MPFCIVVPIQNINYLYLYVSIKLNKIGVNNKKYKLFYSLKKYKFIYYYTFL